MSADPAVAPVTRLEHPSGSKPSQQAGPETVLARLLSLMVWGSPGSFGVDDKELRIEAIGGHNKIAVLKILVFLSSDYSCPVQGTSLGVASGT